MPSLKARLLSAAFRARRALALLAAFGLVWTPLAAQEQGDARIRVDVNLVLLEATVKDKAGQVMKDLKKEDFALDEDGVA